VSLLTVLIVAMSDDRVLEHILNPSAPLSTEESKIPDSDPVPQTDQVCKLIINCTPQRTVVDIFGCSKVQESLQNVSSLFPIEDSEMAGQDLKTH